MATISYDRSEFHEAWMDTAMNACCVMQRGGKGLCGKISKPVVIQGPKATAQIMAVNALEVVIIGHGWDDTDKERFVWRGTAEEFHAEWDID